jgi:hypothetical protein
MDKTMTQIKFTIESDVVAAFKARCEKEAVSMTSEIRRFMSTSRPSKALETRRFTRPLRRKAMKEIIGVLTGILESEAEYREKIPEQFEQRIEAADMACEQLAEAIACLEEVF